MRCRTMEETALTVSRYKTVIKANELIQKSRFNLSLQQQKIVLYLISQISMYDEEFKVYEFSIPEFCRVCGIDDKNGQNYIDLKQAIKDIADKSLWIKIDEDEETLLRWIQKPYINKHSGTIKIKLDEDMKPYLLQLKGNFTRYELLWTLNFRSKYTIRLYELIKSIHYHELETYTRDFSLDDLRRLMGAEKYTTYQAFKSRALIPAITEINNFSDKVLEYQPIKMGKAVVKIRFTIGTKETRDILKLQSDIEKEFGLDQMTLWDTLEERGIVI